MRTRAAARFAVLGLACVALPHADAGPEATADPDAAFFAAFEAGDRAVALEQLGPAVRDASPYDAKTEALPPYARDQALYFRLLERFEAKEVASAAAHREAVRHAAVASIAWREGDVERARRKLLLALGSDPADRMSHLHLARCYVALETEALKGAGERHPGEVLIEKVGFGSADLHLEMAQRIVDERHPPALQAVTATFRFDAGAVRDVQTSRARASANARIQRSRAVAPGARDLCVVLLAADRTRLDEAWFAPVRTLHQDGVGPDGQPWHERRDETSFDVSVELLAPVAATRVLVYDATGTRLAEHAIR